MEISLKLDTDFERTVNNLKDKYGHDFEILNGVAESQLDYSEFIDNFIDKNVKTAADATIDGSANARAKDIVSFKSEKDKSEDKIFAFNKIFYEMKKKYGLKTAKEWLEDEWSGAFYLHDAHTSTYLPYCYAYDLTRLATDGLFFLDNYNHQGPKHLSSFLDMLIEYISFFSNRSAGAVGIPNVLIWTYYFWKKDVAEGYYIKDPDYYLKQCFQKLIYRLNQPFLRITQSSFTNVSIFDRYYVESLFGGVVYPDGSMVVDDIDGFINHEKVFMDVVSDIRAQNMFTYPVLTYSLLKRDDVTDEEWKEMERTHDYKLFKDNDFARWCSDHNTKWNDSNFFGSENVNTLSNCCRLLSDTSKLDAFVNSIGGTALSIGSIKVNTINLMRIALESSDKKDYLKRLKARVNLCCKTLDIQRHIIMRNVEKGLLPNYVDGGIDIKKQYSTVGILGLYEVIKFFGNTKTDEFGCVSYTDDGIAFAEDIMRVINETKDAFGADYSFNIESVPAEKAAVVLCAKDNLLFDRHEDSIYSNQWIPLTAKCTIDEKIKLSAILDPKCGGGAIAHINLENNFPNTDVAWSMLNKIMHAGVIYFAFNTKINSCKHNHGFVGTDVCPICGEPVADTWQRIVGFLTPSQSYSKERFKEFTARQWYKYAEDQKSLID
jgi:anaerobic ribonucleoside-triphosphate reductase